MKQLPYVIVTIGDPAGIGPEITIKSFIKEPSLLNKCHPVIVGDYSVLQCFLKKTKLKYCVTSEFLPENILPKTLNIIDPAQTKNPGIYASPGVNSGRASLAYINLALEIINKLKHNSNTKCSLVTAPVSKELISGTGMIFNGHTEYLAEKTNTKTVAMLMISEKYRVLLATRHIPLINVAENLTQELLIEQCSIAYKAMNDILKIKNPEIFVCGLNPHCGENGKIGTEEKTIVVPAIKKMKAVGMNISGPMPSEYAFLRADKNSLIVTLYHDQAMQPLRLMCGMKFVNATCGLSFLRVSPAHGTAFDIAGRNRANPDSMIEAIKFAAAYN
ncbi:MAG: 4-hydroxythreonine-4-phosphate dehydrogenase PdxA [Elusimicrobia bacterium RIFOXYA2_FULL_39_19]|nr:MAG: 4-hydroxythreonine-4-phosphate dehydrogenase PdxA [Elusimicrobia bacterium RIFOXYA2_FULL_39_19]